jgi:hypothetical protein
MERILVASASCAARLRIWNNPISGYNARAKVLQQARAIKAKGAISTPTSGGRRKAEPEEAGQP